MFAAAYAIATRFTRPLVVSQRFYDGRVVTVLATFVVVNGEGWVATAAHVFGIASQAVTDRAAIATHQAKVQRLREQPGSGSKGRRLARLEGEADKKWMTNHSYWWSVDGLAIREVHVLPAADLALVRLDPPITLEAGHYPVFKNPTVNFDHATSLCRLGFPFSSVEATFDDTRDAFRFERSEFTFFPLDGIFTRTVATDAKDPAGNPILYVETSSPGLRGQSGGPIFDIHGRVWAIQSRTQHLALGFNPSVEVNGRATVAPQFINLGVGTHATTLLAFMADKKVAHAISPE